MIQKVHSVSYLAKAEFELKNGAYDLVALPSGAEVVKVSVEVVGNPTGGHVSVSFENEFKRDYSPVLILNIDKKIGTNLTDYTATSNKVVTVEVSDVSEVENAKGKGVLRVLYFLPSVIEVEY